VIERAVLEHHDDDVIDPFQALCLWVRRRRHRCQWGRRDRRGEEIDDRLPSGGQKVSDVPKGRSLDATDEIVHTYLQ
jgi:hypothetical protein